MIPAAYVPLLKPNAAMPEDVRKLDVQIAALVSLKRLILMELGTSHDDTDRRKLLHGELQQVTAALTTRLAELDRRILDTANRMCDEQLAENPYTVPTVNAVRVVLATYGCPTDYHKFPRGVDSTYFSDGRHTSRVYRVLARHGFVRVPCSERYQPTYAREADRDAGRN